MNVNMMKDQRVYFCKMVNSLLSFIEYIITGKIEKAKIISFFLFCVV